MAGELVKRGRARAFVVSFAAIALAGTTGIATTVRAAPPDAPVDCLSNVAGTNLDVERATIPELSAALRAGTTTSHQLVATYLARIRAWDTGKPRLNSVRELNPRALEVADAMDAARARGEAQGPLAGIPILLKDNLDTTDMHTTAGAVALKDSIPLKDAFVTAKLRAAGAIILGKANLTEFANYVSSNMPAGYSGLGGQVLNPYGLADTPSGSSAGPGVASAMALSAATVGTETDGSILSPSDADSDVGIKPTLGLVSQSGIIPISHRQDTAGPIVRTVTDAAVMLTAMAGVDPADPNTGPTSAVEGTDYTTALRPDALKGVRLGVVRTFFEGTTGQLLSADQLAVANQALADMQAAGATLVDVVVPNVANIIQPTTILMYDFRQDLNAYLARLGPNAPYKTLADIIAFNTAHPEAIQYGQDLMTQSEMYASTPGTGPATDADRLRARTIAQAAIDGGLTANMVQALIFPGPFSADLGANAGYPTVIVPAGYGATSGERLGIAFTGTAYSEKQLIGFAYAYEQVSHRRVSPTVRNRKAFPCIAVADVAATPAAQAPPRAPLPNTSGGGRALTALALLAASAVVILWGSLQRRRRELWPTRD